MNAPTSHIDVCDLCGSKEMSLVYAVPGTARGLSVYTCMSCGLVQSLPRIDHVPRNSPFPDSGAGFGNIRYGKGFRTEFALETIAKHIDLSNVRTCLDVGANRGSFLLALLEKAPGVQATAVEPDERVLDAYKGHQNITLINDRVENIDLGSNKYDLVYHCHTLEHQAQPLASLKAVCRSMKDSGIMFLEVPNIAFLAGKDLVEEWFIDKHLYHYSIETLCNTVRAAGFDILQEPNEDDVTNVTVIVRKAMKLSAEVDVNEGQWARSLIEEYSEQLLVNQEKLKTGAGRLTDYCKDKRVAIWGAGRIYTSIVDVGGFDPTALCCVVDKNLHKYVSEMFGVSVYSPEKLPSANPEVVLVASRLYFDEIRDELSGLLPAVEVITLDDVLAGTIGHANRGVA